MTSYPGEDLTHVLDRARDVAIGGEPEVDRHGARVGYHVARNAAVDAHRRKPLAIQAAVDVDRARPVVGQPLQNRRRRVNRVVPEPRSCAVRAGAAQRDLDPYRALAAGFDSAVGRFEHDREVGLQDVDTLLRKAA